MNNQVKEKKRKKLMDEDMDRWRSESPAAGRYTERKEAKKQEREHDQEPPQRREASKT